MKRLAHGAEAVVWEKEREIVKQRLPKAYRLPELDVLMRRQRTRREARILRKLFAIIRVPRVLEEKEDALVLEKIEGKLLKSCLNEALSEKAGEIVGKMHAAGVVHGDLTTSNFIVEENNVVLIDFGLSYHSQKSEDFATDLHVFEEVAATECFKAFWKGYERTSLKAKEVLARLGKLRARGRYKKEG